ncbi:MAG TPA: TolC family protein [Gemmatimonadaceae bacterium]|jgi:outer membrane protein
MKKTLISLLAIPCLARGIFAQGTPVALASMRDTVRRVSIDSDTAFHPIGLQHAIELAQRNAPIAVQARGQIRSANASVRAAYSALIPAVSITAGQSNQTGDRLGQSGNIVPYNPKHPWSYSTGVRSSLRLFDGGQRFYQISQSKADVTSAEANDVAQQFNVALQVKTQYYAILAAREMESAAGAQLDQAQADMNAAAARVSAGAATLSDSLRTVIEVGNARLALITAQNNLRTASAALTRLVAAPYLVTAEAIDSLDRSLSPIDSAELVQLALRGPAVAQASAQMVAAQAAVRSARTTYLPTVDLTFTRGGSGFAPYGAGASGDTLLNRQYPYTNTFQLSASLPLFNNYQRELALAQAQVAKDDADATLRDARLAAQQNIVQQLASLRAAQEQIDIQQASIRSAEEDLRVQQQRYALGASTLLDLLTSQTTLDQQRAALIQARQSYRLARAQIEAVIGRDLQ